MVDILPISPFLGHDKFDYLQLRFAKAFIEDLQKVDFKNSSHEALDQNHVAQGIFSLMTEVWQ
jgi:hypothetical protein